MNALQNQLMTTCPDFVLKGSSVPSTGNFQRVQTLSGKNLFIPSSQVPLGAPSKLTSTWRYVAQGQYTNALQTGGQVSIKLDRSTGFGPVKAARLRLLVRPTTGTYTSDVFTPPTPLLINTFNFQNASGTIITQGTGDSLWLLNILSNEYNSFLSMNNYLRSSKTYELAPPILEGTEEELFIPLTGNWLETSNFMMPASVGDLMCYFNFWPGATSGYGLDNIDPVNDGIYNGMPLDLVELSLDLDMTVLPAEELQSSIRMLKSIRTDYFVPYLRTQRFTQTWTASSQYTLPLSGIKGDVVFILMTLRKELLGQGLLNTAPIANFQFQDSGGSYISSPQLETSIVNQFIHMPQTWTGLSQNYHYIYGWNFSGTPVGPMAFITNGCKFGQYPFTTNEKFVLNTFTTGTDEVMRATASGTAASGQYEIWWVTSDGTNVTAPLAYNASAATIKAAIEDLPLFQGTVTVSGALTGATTDFTFGGAYTNMPLSVLGYNLKVISRNAATVAPAAVVWTCATQTAGVEGISNNSSYTLDFYAYTSNIVSFEGGNITVASS